MKKNLFIILSIVISHCAFAQGLTKNGQITSTSSTYVNKNGTVGGSTGVDKNGQIVLAATVPVIATTTVSSIAASTASSGGNITSNGGSSLTAEGICWSTSTNPTIGSGNQTNDGTATGSFTSTLGSTLATLLTPGTTYYVRAYATNSTGTGYGTQVSFTTLTVAVGDSFEGGEVGYILASGDAGFTTSSEHGIIVATADLLLGSQTGYTWGLASPTMTSFFTSYLIGQGNANTTAIVAFFGPGTVGTYYAATGCRAYSVTAGSYVYSDWYLPSMDELAKFYSNAATIGLSGTYWSSSQYSSAFAGAVYINFSSSATPIPRAIGVPDHVRPARSF